MRYDQKDRLWTLSLLWVTEFAVSNSTPFKFSVTKCFTGGIAPMHIM